MYITIFCLSFLSPGSVTKHGLNESKYYKPRHTLMHVLSPTHGSKSADIAKY